MTARFIFPSTILVTSLLALTLSACSGDKSAAAMGPGGGGPPAPEVDVMVAARGTSTLTQDLPGRLQAVRTAQVRARVEGLVEKRLFVEGSQVRQGAPLFQIDDRNYQAAATSATVDVAVLKNALARYEPLLPSRAVSQQEYDQAQVKLLQTEAALTRARIDLENTRVPAPISGRIGRALVTEGALVGKGEATHLATIEQIDPIYANFTQSNAELLRLQQAIRAGKLKHMASTRVELLREDGSVYALPGRLLFTDLSVDPDTGSVAMRAEFPNPQQELLPGQFVRVRIDQAQIEQAIRLPQRAVLSGDKGQSVLIVNADNKVELRPVVTGGMQGSDWLISDGLKGDERVIIHGMQKARPGMTVNPVVWQPDAARIGGGVPAPAAIAQPSGLPGTAAVVQSEKK